MTYSRFIQILLMFIGTLVLIPQTSNGQKAKELAKQNAEQHIKDLKNGVLLVRLHTNQLKIKKLKEMGRTDAAQKEEVRLDSLNTQIMRAMKIHYDFSKVLFFNAEDSKEIKDGNYAGNVFNAEGDSAGIGDVPVYIMESRYISFESMNTRQHGFAIATSDFKELDRPFPYYVRKRNALKFLRRNAYEMAIKLNEQLTEYYQEVLGTKY